jgi:RNA polymerase sigma factor (sigma-70 family)
MNGRTVGRLWARYLKMRDELRTDERRPDEEVQRETERQAGQLRDRLVVNYSPLVKYVASRVGARMPRAVEQEDMISWGVLGLLDAVETYDPDRPGKKAKFESYAISKIRWAILDQLRSQDWVPRRVRMRAQEIESATVKLTQHPRRPPAEAEIAGEAGLEVGGVSQLSRPVFPGAGRLARGASGDRRQARDRVRGASRGLCDRRASVPGEPRRPARPAHRCYRPARGEGTSRRDLLLLRRFDSERDRQSPRVDRGTRKSDPSQRPDQAAGATQGLPPRTRSRKLTSFRLSV